MQRPDENEWMDDPSLERAPMVRVLSDLALLNRFFGGAGPTLRALWPMVRRLPGPVRVLDVAAGDGQMLRMIVDRARHEGVTVQATALDIHPTITAVAAEACQDYPEITVEQGDALSLPYSVGSYDFCLSCLAMHHFGPENVVLALREMRRVSRRGMVINDLRRSRLAYATTVLALNLLPCHRVTRHDGPLSIRRAFSREEYASIIQSSGIRGIQYREALWFRSLLTWEAGESDHS